MLFEQYASRLKFGLGSFFAAGVWYTGYQLSSCESSPRSPIALGRPLCSSFAVRRQLAGSQRVQEELVKRVDSELATHHQESADFRTLLAAVRLQRGDESER